MTLTDTDVPMGTDTDPAGVAEGSAQPTPAGDGAADDDRPVRYCELNGCPGTVSSPAPNARYCDDHAGRTPERRKIRRQWIAEHGKAEGAGSDEPPRVAFEVGRAKAGKAKGSATAEELAAVEQRAKQLTKGLAILLVMGQPDERRRADAADVLGGSDAFAAALRDLAVYEPWVRALGTGGEMSERGTAWAAVAVAVGTMLTPILIRHEVIKGAMANALGQILEQPALA